jgi:outer membrane protein
MHLFSRRLSAILLLTIQPVFADDLLSIYQQALQADPQLRTAELKVDVGNAQKGQALGQLLPQINGTANWSTNKQSVPGFADSNYNGTRYYVSLSQSLIDFAKFWDWKRAQEVENQYNAELTEAQHTLLFDVVQRYFAILDAEDQLQLMQMEKQSTETELGQVNYSRLLMCMKSKRDLISSKPMRLKPKVT